MRHGSGPLRCCGPATQCLSGPWRAHEPSPLERRQEPKRSVAGPRRAALTPPAADSYRMSQLEGYCVSM